MPIQHSTGNAGLADILERILDKGIVIAGDISVSLVGVELLTIRIRLVVASVDRALEMGIRWWESDSALPAAGHLPQPTPPPCLNGSLGWSMRSQPRPARRSESDHDPPPAAPRLHRIPPFK